MEKVLPINSNNLRKPTQIGYLILDKDALVANEDLEEEFSQILQRASEDIERLKNGLSIESLLSIFEFVYEPKVNKQESRLNKQGQSKAVSKEKAEDINNSEEENISMEEIGYRESHLQRAKGNQREVSLKKDVSSNIANQKYNQEQNETEKILNNKETQDGKDSLYNQELSREDKILLNKILKAFNKLPNDIKKELIDKIKNNLQQLTSFSDQIKDFQKIENIEVAKNVVSELSLDKDKIIKSIKAKKEEILNLMLDVLKTGGLSLGQFGKLNFNFEGEKIKSEAVIAMAKKIIGSIEAIKGYSKDSLTINTNLNFYNKGIAPTREQSKDVLLKEKTPVKRHHLQKAFNKVKEILKEAIKYKDGKSISLRLDPPHLGTVKVELTLHNGSLTARLFAINPQVNEHLRDKAYELQKILRESGIEADKVMVNITDEEKSFEEFNNAQGEYGQKNNKEREDKLNNGGGLLNGQEARGENKVFKRDVTGWLA